MRATRRRPHRPSRPHGTDRPRRPLQIRMCFAARDRRTTPSDRKPALAGGSRGPPHQSQVSRFSDHQPCAEQSTIARSSVVGRASATRPMTPSPSSTAPRAAVRRGIPLGSREARLMRVVRTLGRGPTDLATPRPRRWVDVAVAGTAAIGAPAHPLPQDPAPAWRHAGHFATRFGVPSRLSGWREPGLVQRPDPADRRSQPASATRLRFARVSSIPDKVLGMTVSTIVFRRSWGMALTISSADGVSCHDSSTSVPSPMAVNT